MSELHDAPRLTFEQIENFLKQPGHVLGQHKWHIPAYQYFVEYNPQLVDDNSKDETEKVVGLVHWRDYHKLTKSGKLEQFNATWFNFWAWKVENPT